MALTKLKSSGIADDAVTAAQIASGAVDTAGLQDDIALIGFKVATVGSLGKYNLVDQTEDSFVDATGIDASASTQAVRDAGGKILCGFWSFGAILRFRWWLITRRLHPRRRRWRGRWFSRRKCHSCECSRCWWIRKT